MCIFITKIGVFRKYFKLLEKQGKITDLNTCTTGLFLYICSQQNIIEQNTIYMNQQKTIDNSISWKLLLRRLQKDKAVLLIGPEVIMASHHSDQTLKEALQTYIQNDLEGILEEDELKRIQYYSEDGFFFLEDSCRLDVIESVQSFYEMQNVTHLYRKLAQLPFHLTISLSPDRLLTQAFEALDLPYHFHYYDKTNFNKNFDDKKLNFKPSKDNRLIYNIFGSIDNETSLILSYDDLFEFIQRIFNNYKLPKTIEDTLISAKCFIFIGFNYSKWYLKLLLRLMNMHQKMRKIYGMDKPIKKDIEAFFVNEFDMNFTHLDATSFIDELYKKCEAENILIKPSTLHDFSHHLPSNIVKKSSSFITNNLFKEVFDLLNSYALQAIEKNKFETTMKVFNNELQLIIGRYNQLEKDNQTGVLLHQDYLVILNKIRRDLSNLINEFS